ncbi:hypothetical protein PINS_up003288 [Pythium insidiosum]|nr:hypothetical protein PINS_up003288 [Pythium insidiosum]
MALVVGSGAFWTTKPSTALTTRSPTNNVPTATKFPTTPSNVPTNVNPTNSPPPNASSRRRSTSDSSDALHSQSQSHSSGSHTQNSSSPSSSSSAAAAATVAAAARRRRLSKNNVVLHVQHCAFGLQDHVLKRRCRVLHEQLRRLRAAASAGCDRVVAIDAADDREEKTSVRPPPLPFVLRLYEPAPRPQGLSQQRVVARADASGCSCDTLPLTTVSCLQHARTTNYKNGDEQGDDEHDDDETKPLGDTQSFTGSSGSSGSSGLSRWREEHSPGKENYSAASSVNTAMTPLVRPRASSLRPLPLTGMKPPPSRSVSTVGTQTSPTSKKQLKKQNKKQQKRSSVLHVELVAADASAVAVLLEFLYCGKIASPLPTPVTAREVTRLCRWLCLENRLLVVMLAQQLQALPELDGEWMDLLLQSARMRSAAARRVLLERCLQRLADLVPTDSYASAVALSALPLHRLAAIEDADVFTTAVLCIFNRVRHLEIWSRLTAAVELWLHWSFRRPMVSLTPPMALRDVHASFAPWEPVISLAPIDVSGLDAYVRPTTLFRIGEAFAFQVRLEPDGLALMHWRVIRVNDDREDDEEDEEDEEEEDDDVEMTTELEPEPEQPDEHHVRAIATMLQQYEQPTFSLGRRQLRKKKNIKSRAVARDDPAFTLRGRLCVRFRYGARGPLLQQTVSIRYTHGPKAYGQWHVLLSAASSDAEVIAPPPADPFSVDSESEAPDTQSPDPAVHAARPEAETETFELLAARFSGQFFAWGHAVCNLYHYLLLATLFYQAPADAPPQDRVRAAAERMRELPVDTLLVVLASDRLRVPGGETTLVAALSMLCAAPFCSLSIADMRALFSCVRWCFVELEQIMTALESSPRALRLYELVESQLGASTASTAVRRVPWGVPSRETPYRANTTLIEFQIEAGDRSLSPSKFLLLAD